MLELGESEHIRPQMWLIQVQRNSGGELPLKEYLCVCVCSFDISYYGLPLCTDETGQYGYQSPEGQPFEASACLAAGSQEHASRPFYHSRS